MLQLGDDLNGPHFAELTADPYATRDMRIVVHLNPEVWTFGLHTPHQRGLTILGPGLSVETKDAISTSNDRISAPVACVDETLYENEEVAPVQFSFGFRFPVVALMGDPHTVVRDAMVGFSLGTAKRQPDGRLEITPVSSISVMLDGVEIEVSSEFSFRSGGTARYPEETLIRESLLAFSIETPAGQREPPHGKARRLADTVLQFVSVLERDRIRWTRQMTAARGTGGTPAGQWRRTRWSSPPRSGGPRRSVHNGVGALSQLVAAYDALDAPGRTVVDRVCGEFEIAATAGDVETSLVRWHSVMDFFCKRAGYDEHGQSTAKRVLKTCDAAGVRLDDLIDAAELARVRNGEKRAAFSFTTLRNAFVHDGFDVFDGRFADLCNAEEAARALAERLLLSLLNLGAEVGPLGTVPE